MTKAHIIRIMKKVISVYYRKQLKNRDFSIISNNCWGGQIYDHYGMEYKTPTVGLWFYSSEYIKFISNLRYYLECDLEQISWRECHFCMLLKEREKKYKKTLNKSLDDLIIGRLDDIDIVFLHYSDFKDAKEKWNRRKKRINYDNLVVKYNDQNDFEEKYFYSFDEMKYTNKIFMTASESIISNNKTKIVRFPECAKVGYVQDDLDFRKIDITNYLNNLKRNM